MLAEALALALAVLPLLWLALDEVAGAVVVWVTVLGELVLVCDADGCAEVDAHGVAVAPAGPGLADAEPSPGVGRGVPPPSRAPVPPGELLLPAMAEVRASVAFTNTCRAGGTTDRTTPTANTATPIAKAGRSIASRQSQGRCGVRRRGACRGWPCPPRARSKWPASRRETRRPTRSAAKPEMASQTPSAALGRLAWAGRDRILARIRSRPSAPGCT